MDLIDGLGARDALRGWLARQARTRKEVFRAELARHLGGLDLDPAKAVLTACLADTPFGQTVRRRQARSTSGQSTRQ
jgi:hypothetical protein